MKEIREIRTPIEYRFERIDRIPNTYKYEIVVSANSHGFKTVEAKRKDIKPLMSCTSSQKLEKMVGKHIIDNEVGCPLLEKIRNMSFSSG